MSDVEEANSSTSINFTPWDEIDDVSVEHERIQVLIYNDDEDSDDGVEEDFETDENYFY